jgi:hypothetical protein
MPQSARPVGRRFRSQTTNSYSRNSRVNCTTPASSPRDSTWAWTAGVVVEQAAPGEFHGFDNQVADVA